MTAWRRPLAAAGVLLAVALAAGLVRPAAARPRVPSGGVVPVRSATLVCPDLSGAPSRPTVIAVARPARALGLRLGPDRVSVRPLTGQGTVSRRLPAAAMTRVTETTPGTAAAYTLTGPDAGALAVDQTELLPHGSGRALVGTPCRPTATDWWFVGLDGRIGHADQLVLANPTGTVANLTVNAWSLGGPLQPARLSSFTVGAYRALRLTVADYVPDAGVVTLHVHANSGRIAAAALDHRMDKLKAAGQDWLGPSLPPSTSLVVPGFPGWTGRKLLVLANPGRADATVALRLVTTSGDFAPAGHAQVVVPAGHTAAVDLTTTLGADAGSVAVTADHPVTAAGYVRLTGSRRQFAELAWLPAVAPLHGPAMVAEDTPPFNRQTRLYLTAPQATVPVRVTSVDGPSTVVTVPAQRVLRLDPTQLFGPSGSDGVVVLPLGPAPLYVVRALYAVGTHGPLVTAEDAQPVPQPARLPAAVPDLRAGLR